MCIKLIFFLSLVLHLSTADDKNCKNGAKCMIVENCKGIYETLKLFDRTNLLKLLQELNCGFDKYKSKICCPPSFQETHESYSMAGQLNTKEAINLLPNKTVCGLHINYRTVRGEVVTQLDEHPWMAIIFGVSGKTKVLCGGVLISSRYVMTAAHCVKSFSDTSILKVRLGEWKLTSKTDCLEYKCSPKALDVNVEEVVAHEKYGLEDKHNDIALIRLDRNIPFTDFVKPICLPLDTNGLNKNSFDTYSLELAGWGIGEGFMSDFKIKARVSVTNSQECRLGHNITENQICAKGLYSCMGDSGGPLMGQIASDQNWIALGVGSYRSLPCGTLGPPGVYTRVASYIDWILSKIRP